MKAELIAPCGMNCRLCYAYIREQNRCNGCRGPMQDKPASCTTCKIVVCEKRIENGWETCAPCDTPCKRLKYLDKQYRTKYHSSMVENLAIIREQGIEALLKQQDESYRCPSCQSIACVHLDQCPSCDAPVWELVQEKSLMEHVAVYQDALSLQGVQTAYEQVMKYFMSLKPLFAQAYPGFKTGHISPGYLDYTYFSFYNDFLRERKLRLGIVLNHKKMRFELWLMGQNAKVQKDYWDLLKDTKWNAGLRDMPRYSVLETVLIAQPDFSSPDALAEAITGSAALPVDEILTVLSGLGK